MKRHLASLDKEELCDLATKRAVRDTVEINKMKASQWFELNYGFAYGCNKETTARQ